MATLDKANTETYGNPEITQVNIGVGSRPGILVSGHDLKDFEQLLEQTKDSGLSISILTQKCSLQITIRNSRSTTTLLEITVTPGGNRIRNLKPLTAQSL